MSNTGENTGTQTEGRVEEPYDDSEVHIIEMYMNFAFGIGL